ncbi:polysaccharide deacetylase family protein [Plastoroseomonas arctica]|uniref:polysaccharide deacetylase family protein n=1 Tax=Plastoroseomonas arctica TaxID=1509237 RepID=UPI001FE3153D|nr:polysaccharide deacetylase family protein [Plastoroseomonas arctica]
MALARPAIAQARGRVYLTIDTGWGREAEQIAAILRRQDVRATLFVADEPTHTGERSLSDAWAPFWRARVAEGHAFASHTWRHWYLRADPSPGQVRYAQRGGPGVELLDQAGLCAELERPLARLRALAPGARVLPLWRAPGGITTPGALAMARSCGLTHQGWTRNGFLGDELDSTASPNATLLARSLRAIGEGEVLVMHWGVARRRDPYAGVLESLITGLKARGLTFDLLPATGVA